jgi:superfamily II DNA/RNA helicase
MQRSKINHAHYVSVAEDQLADQVVQPDYQAINSFADFGLHEQLLANVEKHGYTTPTPIQDQAIPVLMSGEDVVGIANTGTGKTAAFLLPLIHKVLNDANQGVLILAPTRELAVQIFDELKAFSANLPVGFALCIGGANISNQIERLRRNPHFVIGTPGRIKDLISRHAIKPELFTNVVLDEVDRMLDIGFRKDILYLIAQLPSNHHAALFSATMNNETEEIMNKFLTNPTIIRVKSHQTNNQIHQDIIKIKPGENKIDVLHQLLLKAEFERVIVFGRTKHGINKLEQQLYERGIRVCALHGNKSQNARQRSLQDFKRGRVQALLATDIVARGIDVEGVTHVINFDEPMTYDDYIHRIGRTGRAGKVGKALTFV